MAADVQDVMRDPRGVLVLAAHPDDETLGCGGTIARLAREGHNVSIGILGEGITSRHARREEADPAEISALHARSRAVAEILRAGQHFVYDLPDNRFDTVPLLDVVKIVEELIGRVRPAVVYTQHGGDLNVDHATVFRATLIATRPTGTMPVAEVYSYEVPSATDWAFAQFSPAFRPNVFVDIAETLATKLEAMRLYDSETRAFPHPRSARALEAAARRWGSIAGVQAAEAFELVRSVRR